MQTGNALSKIMFVVLSAVFVGMNSVPVMAQVSKYDSEKRGSIYISVGSNTATHKASTINISQGTVGNASEYTLDKVEADASSTSKLTGLQYNVRVGYFFDYYQTFAIELSYDPVQYHIIDGQSVNLKGTLDNKAIDTNFAFSAANGYFYNIDGANILSVNLVKRFQLYQMKNKWIRLDALAKAGGGPCMPHVYNSIAGKVTDKPSFQMGGWNAGLEAALRVTIMKYFFVEGSYKYSYVRYTDIGVYNGSATQKLMTSQVIFSAGIAFPTTKRNPLFTKPEDNKWKLCIKPIYPEPIEEKMDLSTDTYGREKTADPAPSPAPAPEEPAPSPPEEPSPTPAPEEPK